MALDEEGEIYMWGNSRYMGENKDSRFDAMKNIDEPKANHNFKKVSQIYCRGRLALIVNPNGIF